MIVVDPEWAAGRERQTTPDGEVGIGQFGAALAAVAAPIVSPLMRAMDAVNAMRVETFTGFPLLISNGWTNTPLLE